MAHRTTARPRRDAKEKHVIRPPRQRPLTLTGLILALTAAPAAAYEGYHRLADVESTLRDQTDRHPGLMSLLDAGRSAGGHRIWVARIAADGPVDPDQRPGVFVGANAAGYHNAGTEAALGLIRTLLENAGGETAELLQSRTFYVAPVLNPDAHDGLFAAVRSRRSGNAMTLDHDGDGLEAEDGGDDLDGDGRITRLRIPDAAGAWLPHPEDPRVMVRQDAAKGWVGVYRLESEGRDDDGDGSYNEDRAFPHAFPFPDVPEAGPWPGYAPEAKALLDFFFARRHIALAVIYGPANNLLELPESLGGGGDLGSQKFQVPERAAEFIGLDPEEEYSIDEVWEAAKDLPFVRQNDVTKDQLAQFLGAGPATQLEDDDRKLLESLAEDYEKRLEDAGLDTERPAEQYAKGGLTPWLYYQFGALALELDVWGIPEPEKEAEEGEAEKKELTVDGLADMSSEEFLEFSEEEIAAFMKEAGVPAQLTAAMVIQRVEAGQITPAQMARMIQSRGGGGDGGDDEKDDPRTRRRRDVLAWLEANHPEAITEWTEVTLPGGRQAEAGGVDPFAEIAPPRAADLETAIGVHTETVLDLAARLARLEIASLEAEDLGGGVYRVKAVVRNAAELPTHTKMAERARARLPIRLEIETGGGVELVTGREAATAERLAAKTGTLTGEWLVQASPGATLRVTAHSETAGSAEKTHTLAEGGSR